MNTVQHCLCQKKVNIIMSCTINFQLFLWLPEILADCPQPLNFLDTTYVVELIILNKCLLMA